MGLRLKKLSEYTLKQKVSQVDISAFFRYNIPVYAPVAQLYRASAS